MAAELRWILLGLSLPLLAGIWWWTARRSCQSPGNAELRESTAGRPAHSMPTLDPRYADADEERDDGGRSHETDRGHGGYGDRGHDYGADHDEHGRNRDSGERDHDRDGDRGYGDERGHGDERDAGRRMRPEPQGWGVPPFEPLSIRTADFDQVPVLDGPMMVNSDPAPISTEPLQSSSSRPLSAGIGAEHGDPPAEQGDDSPAARAPAANAADLQRIVTIRVCSVGETRWSGTQLMAALELHGLAFGRYQVFHRKHTDGRSLFCVASLIEPGTFDVAEMPDQEYRGITLFAVLPGPIEPLETMDELFRTARGLAEQLSGMVQDGKGMPLSPQRAAALREDIARFQASLH